MDYCERGVKDGKTGRRGDGETGRKLFLRKYRFLGVVQHQACSELDTRVGDCARRKLYYHASHSEWAADAPRFEVRRKVHHLAGLIEKDHIDRKSHAERVDAVARRYPHAGARLQRSPAYQADRSFPKC